MTTEAADQFEAAVKNIRQDDPDAARKVAQTVIDRHRATHRASRHGPSARGQRHPRACRFAVRCDLPSHIRFSNTLETGASVSRSVYDVYTRNEGSRQVAGRRCSITATPGGHFIVGSISVWKFDDNVVTMRRLFYPCRSLTH